MSHLSDGPCGGDWYNGKAINYENSYEFEKYMRRVVYLSNGGFMKIVYRSASDDHSWYDDSPNGPQSA